MLVMIIGIFMLMGFVSAAINYNIVAYFKLDETSGTSALDSVAGKNATISANVTLNQAGILGTSYSFNGSSKVETQVTVSDIGLNDFSTSWWMYKQETGAIKNLFMNYQTHISLRPPIMNQTRKAKINSIHYPNLLFGILKHKPKNLC